MRKLPAFFIGIALILFSLHLKAQITVKNSSDASITALEFCSTTQETVTIKIQEEYDDPTWLYKFSVGTGNTITLRLPDTDFFYIWKQQHPCIK